MPINIQLTGADALEKAGQIAKGSKETLLQDIFRESRRFGLDAVGIAKREYLRGPRPDTIQSDGALKSTITSETEISGNTVTTKIGSNLVYARIHELGGVTRPAVTDKMRKFAWFMFFKTGDDKFKRLALTKKNRLNINIKARPYLSPAIDDAMPNFKDNLARILMKINFEDKRGK